MPFQIAVRPRKVHVGARGPSRRPEWARRGLSYASLCALVLCLLGAKTSAEEPLELPPLPGYSRAATRDLNNRKQVVGQAFGLGVRPQAVLWSGKHGEPYAVEELPTLHGLVDGNTNAIARSGIPVGSSSLFSPGFSISRAVVWKKVLGEWEAVDLEPPPGYTDAVATGVTSRGKIVGYAFNPGELFQGDIVRRAVLWQPRRGGSYAALVLETPDGFQTQASGINEWGDVVGRAYRTEFGDDGPFERSDVVVWRRTWGRHGCGRVPVVLPSLPGLPMNRDPAINPFGHVVARAEVRLNGALRTRPVFWKRRHWKRRGPAYGEPVELPVPEGFSDAAATDVNVIGRVVGTASLRDAGNRLLAARAVVWSYRHRRGWTVEELTAPDGARWLFGVRLNDRGSVVGNDLGPPAGSTGALLWKRAAKPRWPW
jgi:uncharacterized membrane protein